jgi:hypothetical protein
MLRAFLGWTFTLYDFQLVQWRQRPFSSVSASLVIPPTAMVSTIGEALLREALCLWGSSP